MRVRWAVVALLFVPLADAALLVVVADALGWLATVALVVLTGLVGMLLVRAEGRHTLRELNREVASGSPPTDQLLDGALLVAAGAFLLTPGLVTDAIGFLFAVPVTRYPVRALLKRYVVTPYLDRKTGGFVTGQVWTAGFPDEGTVGPGAGPATSRDDETFDVDSDSYRVDDEGDRGA